MKIKTILPLLMLTAASASASFNFSLTPGTVTTLPGGNFDLTCFTTFCAIFNGTVTTDSVTTINITDLSIDFPGTPDNPNGDTYLSNAVSCIGNSSDLCNYFLQNGPFFVDAADPYSGPIFALDVDPNTPLGIYDGVASLYGGPNISDTALLGTFDFQVDVETPEPATFGLMLLGLAAGVFALRKRAT